MAVSPTSKTLNVGETVQLTGTKNPSTASEGTQWTSSNTSVATVSNSGLVTAKSAGTATITFKNS
ncbi:MAG: Ig domain-containing protein, partial [Clostridia bacterium]